MPKDKLEELISMKKNKVFKKWQLYAIYLYTLVFSFSVPLQQCQYQAYNVFDLFLCILCMPHSTIIHVYVYVSFRGMESAMSVSWCVMYVAISCKPLCFYILCIDPLSTIIQIFC